MDNGIDLVKYGVLWERVENYEKKFDSMERKIDKMEGQLETLVGMAERSKGSLWALMGAAGIVGSVVSFLADFIFIKK